MQPFVRAGRLAMALGASLLLTVSIPTSAQAANGTFGYRSLDGNYYIGQNLHSGECMPLVDGATRIDNDTDEPAFLFHSGDFYCSAQFADVPPHSSKIFGPGPDAYPYWVEFI